MSAADDAWGAYRNKYPGSVTDYDAEAAFFDGFEAALNMARDAVAGLR